MICNVNGKLVKVHTVVSVVFLQGTYMGLSYILCTPREVS